MLFTNQVIFSSREFRPPEKLEIANLLSDEPTANSIMTKVIIHVLNFQESIGLDGFQKDSKTSLFGPNGETDKILAKGKDGFRPDLKGTCLGPYEEYILHLSKSWSWLYEEVVQVSHILLWISTTCNPINKALEPRNKADCFPLLTFLSFLVRLSPCFDPSFVGPVRHIRQRSKSVSPFIPSVLNPLGSEFISTLPKSDPYFGSIKWYQSHSLEKVQSLFCGLVVEEKACWLRRNPAFEVRNTCVGEDQTLESVRFMMFGLQRKSNKEKPQRNSNSQTPFKYPLNYFDEFVSVQEQPAIRRKTTRDVADPRRRLLQFDVQQFCDNFVKGVDKALKDVSKSQKKSTSTRAPVAEPSLFISKKAQGESENHFEELKDFSDSLPIFDESDEELIESLMFCEKDCDLPSLETEFNLDNEQAIVGLTVLQSEHPSSLVLSQQDFEEEPLDIPHQCPCLDIWTSLDEVPEPIFDEVDEPDPVFDEEATSIISTFMESHLCFDSGTTTASSSPSPLLHDLQEHCEEPSSLNSLPDMVVKVSTDDVIRFGLDKMKKFCVSKSVFDNMINSLKIFEPDKCLDQSRFQNVNGITSGIILSSDQFLEHNKGFHLLGRPFDLDLQQTDFCAEKSLDLFVCKGNGFDLSSSRHVLITDELFASSYALDEILIQKLVEQKSLKTENDFRDLEFCGSVLQPDLLSFKTDKTWYFLRSFRDNGVVLSSDNILVYNTFFEKCLELLINDSQTELKLVCSDVGKDMHILKMNTVVAYLDKILVCNIYFVEHLDRLKNVQFVLGKDILICDLNKYLSCTFDPGLLVFFFSIQERQVQPLNESIGRAQQPQIWRSFVVQTGYLGASDRGSVQEGYLNIPKISKGDSCPRKNRPEPKPILHEPKVFPRSFYCLNQKHCKDHELIASTLHENVLKPRISKRKHILTWLKNVLLKPFHELISLSCALKEIWFRKRHDPKLLRPKNQFDFIHDKNFSDLTLTLPDRFSAWPNFKIDKPIFGDQFTCLMLVHVLDDYPKGLDPDLDVLKIEKPFDYFFRRFDVVSRVILNEQVKHDQFPRRASAGERLRTYVLRTWNWKYLRETSSKLQGSKIDLRSNPFEEGGNDVPWSSAPGKTDMHGLIIGSSNDICSLFDSYLLNHEASTHEITWRMLSTQLRSS
ncbi:hypothetical protein IGI04_019580 [Brassica rapa subsp. trilocularis]|uniref:Ubiquitin-like protease family profile domain-containing protein n=1 Tax=Brassica rapa subsp. trilocularis TaxID=1813537 RepID=A0ABQ7MIN0_BRACM|nr:hypothetical protein IGI04_019580 [Brassica rapa subsp. trilocularis]